MSSSVCMQYNVFATHSKRCEAISASSPSVGQLSDAFQSASHRNDSSSTLFFSMLSTSARFPLRTISARSLPSFCSSRKRRPCITAARLVAKLLLEVETARLNIKGGSLSHIPSSLSSRLSADFNASLNKCEERSGSRANAIASEGRVQYSF